MNRNNENTEAKFMSRFSSIRVMGCDLARGKIRCLAAEVNGTNEFQDFVRELVERGLCKILGTIVYA